MMKKCIFTLLFFALVTGLSLMAEANFENKDKLTGKLIYNADSKAYHLENSARFADQTLEQKYLTIQTINANETEIETDN